MKNYEVKRNQIIEVITAPLGFFVLALLIVESFLATILIGVTLEKSDKVIGMYVGVGLFIFVIIIVALFVWFKPEHLTFDKEAHLRFKNKPPFGSNDNKIDINNSSKPTTANVSIENNKNNIKEN